MRIEKKRTVLQEGKTRIDRTLERGVEHQAMKRGRSLGLTAPLWCEEKLGRQHALATEFHHAAVWQRVFAQELVLGAGKLSGDISRHIAEILLHHADLIQLALRVQKVAAFLEQGCEVAVDGDAALDLRD